MKCCAGRDCPHYGEKRPREARREAVGQQHQCHHSCRQAKSRDVRMRQLSHDLQQLIDRICAVNLELEHVAEDSNSDLESDTGKKSDQDGSRQKIGEETELKQTGQQQESSCQQRY
jgi:hypothetical protein